MSLNRIIIMGRLTRNPELRHTQTGTPVAACTLAVDRDFKDQSGNKQTDFIDIVAWRNSAEFLAKYFSKGRMAVVEGRLQIRDWTDKDGNKRKAAEVIADNIYFGDSKKDEGQQGYGAPAYGQQTGGYVPQTSSAPAYGGNVIPMNYGDQFEEVEEDDGELPF